MIKLVVFFQRWNFNIVTPSNLCVCYSSGYPQQATLCTAGYARLIYRWMFFSLELYVLLWYHSIEHTQLIGISFVRRMYKCSVVIVGQIKEKYLVSSRMIMGFRDWSWFSSIIFQNSAINPEINYIVDSLNECNTNAVQSWTAICCQLKKGTPPGRLKDFRASSFFTLKLVCDFLEDCFHLHLSFSPSSWNSSISGG